jgi:hypothetical protein
MAQKQGKHHCHQQQQLLDLMSSPPFCFFFLPLPLLLLLSIVIRLFGAADSIHFLSNNSIFKSHHPLPFPFLPIQSTPSSPPPFDASFKSSCIFPSFMATWRPNGRKRKEGRVAISPFEAKGGLSQFDRQLG